ncbi:MAG: hypothetical protein ACFFB3_14425, partial [Candidatus Hodarchaeota archaeon]
YLYQNIIVWQLSSLSKVGMDLVVDPLDPDDLRKKAQTIGSLGTLFFLIGVVLGGFFFLSSGWHLAIDLFQPNSDLYTFFAMFLIAFLGIGASLWGWAERLYSAAANAELEKLERELDELDELNEQNDGSVTS